MMYPGPGMPPVESAQKASVLDDAKAIWADVAGLLQDRVELALLETQQAGKGLVKILIAGVIIALLLITAWLGVVSAIILWLVHIGLMVSLAIMLGVLANLFVAVLLYRLIQNQIRHLGWPATMRSLRKPVPKQENDYAGT